MSPRPLHDEPQYVGFIGLGRMGGPMARNLVRAGMRVHGWDTAGEARSSARELGVEMESSARALIDRCDVTILMLPDSPAVDAVIDDLISTGAALSHRLIVDMGSSEPTRTRALEARLHAIGASFIDAPVSGGVRGAEQAKLTIMVGGESGAVGRAMPILQHLGSTVVHVGPAGAGHALKALNNLLSAAGMLVAAEAVVAAMRFGIAPETAIDVVNRSTGRSWSTEYKFPTFVLSRSFASGFSARLMEKDLRTAVALEGELNIDTPLSAAVAARWSALASQLPADADHTEIVTPVERSAGVRIGESGVAPAVG